MPRKGSWEHKINMKCTSHVAAQTGIHLDVQPESFGQGKHTENRIFFN